MLSALQAGSRQPLPGEFLHPSPGVGCWALLCGRSLFGECSSKATVAAFLCSSLPHNKGTSPLHCQLSLS
jgi:hypothetical protein